MSLVWLKVYARLGCIALFAAALNLTASAQDSSSGASASPTSEVVTPQAKPPQAPQPQTSSQQPTSMRDYAKPKSHFPNLIAPYTPTHIAPAIFSNTGRIDQLLQNGKLYLSMDDAVTLALENNMDIAIARYTLSIADTDILRAKAGSAVWARLWDRAPVEPARARVAQAQVWAASSALRLAMARPSIATTRS